MQYLTIQGHTIQVGAGEFSYPYFDDMRRSEILPGKQAPLTVANIKRFIDHPWSQPEDCKVAVRHLLHIVNELDYVKDALEQKANTVRLDETHCEVSLPHSNPWASHKRVNPLEIWKKYSVIPPYSQQCIGAEFAYRMLRSENFFDMRLGKTITLIMLLKRLFEDGRISKAIIVCPKSIMDSVWVKELTLQGLSTYSMVNGYDKDEAAIANDVADIAIISYESVPQRMEIFQTCWDMEDILVAADETTWIKNPKSKRTKAFTMLTFFAKYTCLMSGTPMSNGPHNIWPQRFCTDRGQTLGANYTTFYNRFCAQTYTGKIVVNSFRRMAFELAIQRKSLRFIRGEGDQFSGKDHNFKYIRVPPTHEQFDATNDVANGLVRLKKEDPGYEIKTHFFTVMGFFREICAGYNKIPMGKRYAHFRFQYDSKAMWVENFLDSNPGVPAVIVTEFDEHEEIMSEMLSKNGIPYVWVKRDAPRWGHGEVFRKFQEGDVRVILMKSNMGYGNTMNRLDAVEQGIGTFPVIIYLEPSWNIDHFKQSQDRCVGTYNGKSICTPIYVISVKGSIEDKMISALRRKQDASDVLLKDIDRENFESFVDSLRIDMSVTSDDEFFDPEEIHSRRMLGISPQLKVTHKKLFKVPGFDPQDECPDYKDSNNLYQKKVRAAHYLYNKYNADGSRDTEWKREAND